MKRFVVNCVQLVLFFVTFVPSVVIGMELEEFKNVSIKEEFKKIPIEVKKLIWTKVLRLVLDEAEDNPHQLISRKKMNIVSSFFVKHVTGGAIECYESANNIDCILKLMSAREIGVDPCIKSYKGNNVLHLLISGVFLQTEYLGAEDSALKYLQTKIELISKYNLDFNAKNGTGNTIAHELLKNYVQQGYSINEIEFIKFLQNLGMSIRSVKNDTGDTAHEMALKLNNDLYPDATSLESVSILVSLNEFVHQDIKNTYKKLMKGYEDTYTAKVNALSPKK